MTLSLFSLLDPAVWTGAGGTALGLITGHVKLHRGRLARLEKEVEECRERDADVVVLTAGVRLIVGEMMREHPTSPALQLFSDLMNRRLGPAPACDDLSDIVRRIDEADARRRERNDEPHA